MSMGDNSGLVVEDVYTAYDKADVLKGVSLSAAAGKITCLLGSNGSGKTTLIRSILGLTRPNRGQIRFEETRLTDLPSHRIIATGIACIPEGRKVFPKLTVDEPSLGLSPILVKRNFEIIQRINQRGITVFLVEQNVHQTLEIADYGYVLSKGQVVAAGTPEELRQDQDVHQAYFG